VRYKGLLTLLDGRVRGNIWKDRT